MGYWWREARVGAAREFGARHYRKFAALELAGSAVRQLARLALPLVVLAVVIALVWVGSRTGAVSSLPWKWIAAAIGATVAVLVLARMRLLVLGAWVAILAGAGWLAWYLATNALTLLLALAGAVATGVALAVVIRRVRRYRLHRFLDDWID